MLKKPASVVLPSKASSTGTRPPHHSAARTDVVLLIRRTVRPRGYASGAFIGCGLADSFFEHPARCVPVALDVWAIEFPTYHNSFSRTPAALDIREE